MVVHAGENAGEAEVGGGRRGSPSNAPALFAPCLTQPPAHPLRELLARTAAPGQRRDRRCGCVSSEPID